MELNVEAATKLLDERDALKKALRNLVSFIDEWESNNEDSGFSQQDQGCLRCTRGVTPNKFNTGLCPYHVAEELAGLR